jgi:hypothetical protein
MTSHVARLYALALSILGLFVAWAGIAAQPWQAGEPPAASAAEDPTASGLAEYRRRLRRDARLVNRVLERRAAEPPPAAPTVRIVPAAPVATTRTS